MGGGACIDFQSNGGASSGGNNYIFYPQCDFFPLSIHLFDQNGDRFFLHTENTDANAVVGSSGGGTAVLVDGTSNTPPTCIDNEISNSSVTSFAQGIYITANCTHTVVTSPSYSGVQTRLTDLGTNSQTVGAAPEPANPTVAFSGNASSVVQFFNIPIGGITVGDVVCFSASNTVNRCPASSTNHVGVAVSTLTSGGTAVVVGVQFAGLANVSLDASVPVTYGNYICVSSTAKGKGTVSGVPCTGKQIGIAAQSSIGSVTTAATFLQKY